MTASGGSSPRFLVGQPPWPPCRVAILAAYIGRLEAYPTTILAACGVAILAAIVLAAGFPRAGCPRHNHPVPGLMIFGSHPGLMIFGS